MIVCYFIIYFLLLLASFCSGLKNYKKFKKIAFVIFLILFILLASFKDINAVKDAVNYVNALQGLEIIFEPSFHIITYIVNNFFGGNPFWLFFIYSLIAIPIKGKAILKVSFLPIYSLLIWFSDLYLVQELTQIRVGVASGIFLLSIPSLYERKLKKYILFTLLATFFHVSAILMLPLWFISSKHINSKLWIFAVFISFIWAYLKLDLFYIMKYIPIEGIDMKYEAYKRMMEGEEQTIFSPLVIGKFAITLFMMTRISLMEKHNRYIVLFLKIMLISIIARSLLATNTSVAFRISEFFGVVEIALIPCLYYIVKDHIMKYGIISFISLAFMSIRIFSNRLIV